MDWVREFYEKQYAWADWRTSWADPPSDDVSIAAHVNAVRRMAGAGDKRVLELGSGTGHVAVGLANAGHNVVAVELLDDLAEKRNGSPGGFGAVRSSPSAAISTDIDVAGPFDVVAYFDGFGIVTTTISADSSNGLILADSRRIRPDRRVRAVVLGEGGRWLG